MQQDKPTVKADNDNTGHIAVDTTTQQQRVTEVPSKKPQTTTVISKKNVVAARPLTRKQKAFADALLADPKLSGTQAVIRTYNASPNTARAMATENLAKPSIQAYMRSQGELASEIGIKLLTHSAKVAVRTDKKNPNGHLGWATLAWQVSEGINDRIHGKATVKTENSSVNLNIQDVLL